MKFASLSDVGRCPYSASCLARHCSGPEHDGWNAGTRFVRVLDGQAE